MSKALVPEKVQGRVRDRRAKVLQGLVEGTPESTDNHWFELAGFIGTQRDAVDVKRNFRGFRVETSDNVKNLAPGYIESLRARYAYNPSLLDSYERGIFTNFRQKNAAYDAFPTATTCTTASRRAPTCRSPRCNSSP